MSFSLKLYHKNENLKYIPKKCLLTKVKSDASIFTSSIEQSIEYLIEIMKRNNEPFVNG
jgi:hypothetical protein